MSLFLSYTTKKCVLSCTIYDTYEFFIFFCVLFYFRPLQKILILYECVMHSGISGTLYINYKFYIRNVIIICILRSMYIIISFFKVMILNLHLSLTDPSIHIYLAHQWFHLKMDNLYILQHYHH